MEKDAPTSVRLKSKDIDMTRPDVKKTELEEFYSYNVVKTVDRAPCKCWDYVHCMGCNRKKDNLDKSSRTVKARLSTEFSIQISHAC